MQTHLKTQQIGIIKSANDWYSINYHNYEGWTYATTHFRI